MIPERKNDATKRVLDLQKNGMQGKDIENTMQQEKFNSGDISAGIDQAAVKNEIAPVREPLNLDSVPSPQNAPLETAQPPAIPQQTAPGIPSTTSFAPEPVGRANYEAIEEIAESVISEKWEEMISNIGDLRLWKEKVETDLSGVKQEILRIESRFENLQKAVLGKVGEYSEGVTNLTTEMKAMEKVFEKILEPLTRNVKELDEITKKMKK
ncbi:hypothetical protein HON86_01420 [Candidatus Woesearchaeota archaeon]|jgi:hypothetical protein|nr:hypothetical protein [Candidatus Woesearchaeota archaeon]MBT4835261.1 hypothetical protein [Candidatus Woesearchaeota archaeon]MBT6734738.1 hypothetical protein [Candidatus Woesearchaeota archaeon]MBT7169939.1 hypothetical protein [Candidatus Woesearchaeota archaeon]